MPLIVPGKHPCLLSGRNFVIYQTTALLSVNFKIGAHSSIDGLTMTGMLDVSLRGANHGIWPHLRCSGRKSHILAVKVSLRVASDESKKKKKAIILFW